MYDRLKYSYVSMPILSLATRSDAPPGRVFDCARSVEPHTESMAETSERAVGGVTEGHLELCDSVTWRVHHFGLPFEMTAAITEYDRPGHFKDEQISGLFASMTHDHHFELEDSRGSDSSTVMRDEFYFKSPAGPLGTLVDRAVLSRHMTQVLERRNQVLKEVAEQTE